jgi:hypothetical protein
MPLLGHVRVKTAGKGPGLLVVHLDCIGGRRSASRVAADEQKTGLALEFRDQLAVQTKHPYMTKDEVTPVICLLILFIADYAKRCEQFLPDPETRNLTTEGLDA